MTMETSPHTANIWLRFFCCRFWCFYFYCNHKTHLLVWRKIFISMNLLFVSNFTFLDGARMMLLSDRPGGGAPLGRACIEASAPGAEERVNWLVCDTWFSQSKYHLEVTRQGSHVSAMVWPKNTLPVPLIIFLFIFFVNNSLVLLISESLYRVPPWYLLCLVRCCIVRNKRGLLQFAMYSFSSIYVDVCLFYRVKHTWH